MSRPRPLEPGGHFDRIPKPQWHVFGWLNQGSYNPVGDLGAQDLGL